MAYWLTICPICNSRPLFDLDGDLLHAPGVRFYTKEEIYILLNNDIAPCCSEKCSFDFNCLTAKFGISYFS